MNQEKIGKLIAKLRKEKGLTQAALGDKVGVGYRAVSKWETGQTLPDISIINELSSILGITSDELLKGELKPVPENNPTKPNNTINKKLLFIPILLISILTIILLIINYNNHKTYVYNLFSEDEEYYVEGNITFKDNEISMFINKIIFIDDSLSKIIITNYEYKIFSGDNLLFSKGNINSTKLLDYSTTVKEFSEIFNINSSSPTEIKTSTIIKNNLRLKITFVDKDNNRIEKEIKILLKPIK